MRLKIRHATVYHYDQPIDYAIQVLRMTPNPHYGLRVLNWKVESDPPSALPETRDGFGNIVHCHTINRPHSRAIVSVRGEVETRDTQGVVAGTPEPLPTGFYLRETALTALSPEIAALAKATVEGIDPQLDRLHALMQAVRDRVDYLEGETESHTPAAAALEAGTGVCQDHAHIFISAARSLGYPARYASGYLWTGGENEVHEASHAWAEAHVPDLGWVGFDPANRVCPTDAYVRTAVGLDYWTAAPLRGIWRGTAKESLDVKVQVAQIAAEQ